MNTSQKSDRGAAMRAYWESLSPDDREARKRKAQRTRTAKRAAMSAQEREAHRKARQAAGTLRWVGVPTVDRVGLTRRAALIRWGRMTPEERSKATQKARKKCAKNA